MAMTPQNTIINSTLQIAQLQGSAGGQLNLIRGAVVSNNDQLGAVYFLGNDGATTQIGAKIESISQGTPGVGRIPADLVFYRSPDSLVGLKKALTIANTGAISIEAPDSGTGLTVIGGGLTISAGTITLTPLTFGALITDGSGVVSAPSGNAGEVLTSNGAGVSPSFQPVGSSIATTYQTDAGNAVPAANTLIVSGGTNINTAGAGNTLTVNLDDTINLAGSITAGTGLTVSAGGITSTGTTQLLSLATNGVLRTDLTGTVSSSNGGAGQLLIGGGAGPVWSNILSTDGTVTITNGVNSIDLSVPAFPGITLTGDAGGALGPAAAFTITGGSSGAVFTGAGTTLTESFNYLALPTTTATNGQIKINGSRFLHAYSGATANSNTFLGLNVGNFTSTTADFCVGIGNQSLQSITTGGSNVCAGYQSGKALQTGSSNVAIGTQALLTNTAGIVNTCIGAAALLSGLGSYNIAIGQNASSAYTGAEGSNIIIGNSGTLGESNKIRIGIYGVGAGQQDTAYIAGVVHGSNGLIADTGNIQATNGNLLLPTTSSTVGQVQINATRFFHAYGTENCFVGSGAGNFTMTGTANNCHGLGNHAAITSGSFNVAMGRYCQNALTSGSFNVGFGYGTMGQAVTGNANVGIGQQCFANGLTSGANNVAIGYQSCTSLVSGSSNVAIGVSSGASLTTNDSSNILLNATGSAGDNNTLKIGAGAGAGAGQLNRAFVHGIYGITPAGGTTNSIIIDSNGQLGSVARTASTAWVPQLEFGGGTTGITYGTQTARYTRVDGVVTFTLNIVLTSKGTDVGVATITGLPTAAAAKSALMTWQSNASGITSGFSAYVSGSTINIWLDDSTGAATNTEFNDTTELTISGSYIV